MFCLMVVSELKKTDGRKVAFVIAIINQAYK
jgi:hypothetical protein